MRQQGISGVQGVRAGSCHAWPLPADATCASVARQVFRESVSGIGLEPDLLEDCVLMASELAANTLHARAVAGTGGGGDRLVSVVSDGEGKPVPSAGPAPQTAGASAQPGPVPQTAGPPGCPEMWLYLRGVGVRRELVCKIFDGTRDWRHGSPPALAGTSAHAVAGRGLHLVQELSCGRWGHHPTRSRLSGWGQRGKAVWFSVPAPLAHARLVDVTGLRTYTLSADVTAGLAYDRLSARQAASELEAMLTERGFGHLVRADQPAADMSVLSVCRGVTVWCRSGMVALTPAGGSQELWRYADLVEAAEQTVRRYEELDAGLDLIPAQAQWQQAH
ncbi:MAG: hypothetical protein WAK82_39960 [Streptosporangiaceae bacterium]